MASRQRKDDDVCPACGLSLHAFQELTKLVEAQGKRIADLEKRLSYYENSNSPPSKSSLIYKKIRRERKEARASHGVIPAKLSGRKLGHIGITQVFSPTKRLFHRTRMCPKCGSGKISVMAKTRKLVVDIPEPQPYTVTEHMVCHYECHDCGANNFIPKSAKRLPRQGILGKNLRAVIGMLYSAARLPYRKIPLMLVSLYGLRLSPATVLFSLRSTAENLEPLEKEVKEKINDSKACNFDETSLPVNGLTRWMWVAATTLYALIIVEKSRGADVLKKHFASFRGVAIVDGWRTYHVFFSLVQRCWAHLLREIEVLSLKKNGSEEAICLHSELKSLYDRMNFELKENPPPNQNLHDRSLEELQRIAMKEYVDLDVRKFVGKLKVASNSLLTFTLYPGVEPTNNRAERALREPVVQRKIRGQLKTDEGAMIFGRIMTALTTWNIQKLNPFKEFKRYL